MKFTLTIESDDDAMVEDPVFEVSRLLTYTGDYVRAGRTEGPLLDSNGNRVGSWKLEV